MKKYDDLTARLLERRDQYVAAQAAKRKRLMRVALPAGGGLLVALLCVGLWQGGAFENTPPVTDGSGQGTIVPAAPTTATGDSAPTDADGTIEGADTTVTTVTTTDVTPSDTVTGDSTQGSGTATQRTEPTTGVPIKDSTTGKTDSTATKTERPTTGKNDPTTGKTKPTTGTTTKPTTKPTTDKTELTTKTTKTTQSSWNGGEFNWDGDTIVVETPITHNDGLFSYAMSAKIPVQCRTTDDNISVLLSYGLLEGCDPADYITNVVLYVLDDEGNKTILRRIDKKEIMTDYRVDWPVDENGQLIGFVYSHTETISLPVSLCSKTIGRIWLVVAEGTSNGKFGVEVSGMSASICFDYVRSDTNIVFIGRDL